MSASIVALERDWINAYFSKAFEPLTQTTSLQDCIRKHAEPWGRFADLSIDSTSGSVRFINYTSRSQALVLL